MYDQLKDLYPNCIILESTLDVDQSQYKWFRTQSGEVVGIPFSDLEQKELNLLSTFLDPYDPNQITLTEREKMWYDWVHHHKTDHNQAKAPAHYRFVFFSLAEKGIEPGAFREAIQGLFPHTMPILWENDHQGFIVEESFHSHEESISYEHVIDVLMSDFYMKLHMYITPYYEALENIPTAYQWGKSCFQTKLTHFSKPVSTYQDIIPYLYIDALDTTTKQHIVSTILGDTVHDQELLKTVRTFLECNSNATLAAKELYMHRNSLQYRVDKFIEKTNLNIKQFQGALLTYLALMHVHSEEDK